MSRLTDWTVSRLLVGRQAEQKTNCWQLAVGKLAEGGVFFLGGDRETDQCPKLKSPLFVFFFFSFRWHACSITYHRYISPFMSQCSLSLILCNFGASFRDVVFNRYGIHKRRHFYFSRLLRDSSTSSRVSTVFGPTDRAFGGSLQLNTVWKFVSFIRYESCADLHRQRVRWGSILLVRLQVEKVPRNRLAMIDTINAKLLVRKKMADLDRHRHPAKVGP